MNKATCKTEIEDKPFTDAWTSASLDLDNARSVLDLLHYKLMDFRQMPYGEQVPADVVSHELEVYSGALDVVQRIVEHTRAFFQDREAHSFKLERQANGATISDRCRDLCERHRLALAQLDENGAAQDQTVVKALCSKEDNAMRALCLYRPKNQAEIRFMASYITDIAARDLIEAEVLRDFIKGLR